jgi:hypothetical protein
MGAIFKNMSTAIPTDPFYELTPQRARDNMLGLLAADYTC